MINKKTSVFFSYQDCWNYAFSRKKIETFAVKNDIITLCGTNSEEFWQNFTKKFLSASYYKKISRNLDKYLSEDYPIPYLTGKVYFSQLSFQTKEGVFIPQSDTEILIEKTLTLAEKIWPVEKKLKVLDIGTGCGNIALSLAKIKSHWEFTAIDINPKALQIAKINAKYHQINNVEFLKSDLFSNLDAKKKKKLNLIISNPPYVSNQEYQKLPAGVKRQPSEALLSPENGTFFYRRICQEAPLFLTSQFLLIMEISPGLPKNWLKLVIKHFPQAKVEIFPDRNGDNRVIAVYKIK